MRKLGLIVGLFAFGCGGDGGGEEVVLEDGTSRPLPPTTGASFGALAGSWDLSFSRVMYHGTTSGSLAVTGRSATFVSGTPCTETDSWDSCKFLLAKLDLSLDGNRLVGSSKKNWDGPVGFSATRKSRAQSVFGDLGGNWEVTWANWSGRTTTCHISALGDRIETDCTNGYLISATFSSGMLSGSDTYGSEFSGRRR